jgi:hypothetical protein
MHSLSISPPEHDPRLDPAYEHSLEAQLPAAGAIAVLCLLFGVVLLVI